MGEKATHRAAATLSEVPALCEFAVSKAAAFGLGEERSGHLRLAVEEAAVNICSYAYPEGRGDLEASVWSEGGRVFVELADWGIPFDIGSVQEPDVVRYLREGRVGGFGVKLIRGFADGVTQRRSGGQNTLTLSFSLGG